MTRDEVLFFALLLVNGLLTLGYLLWYLVFQKDGEHRKQYLIHGAAMLLCPVVGILYFTLSHLKYRFLKTGSRDLSDVEFSKKRHAARIKADEARERNIVSVEEAILISDQEKKRANILNILLGETDESFAAIARALNSDDSEVAHYAASFLQSKMDAFRETVRKTRQKIEEGDMGEEDCQERVLDLIQYMNHMLKQQVFTQVEQADYVDQLSQLCELLFQHARAKLSPACYKAILGRTMELRQYEAAELWGNRFSEQYPDQLSSYTLRLKLYFETSRKEQFFEVLRQLRASSVVIDNRTLELIRMIQT